MTVGSGIGSSIGCGKETVYGSFVTPTRWLEYESETLKLMPNRIQGNGLAQGVFVPRGSQRVTTTQQGGGDLKSRFFYKGMGLYLGALMGNTSLAPVQQGATAAYLQTHVLADPSGDMLTIQKGVPDLGGTIRKYNFVGSKVEKATFECGVDQPLMVTFNIDSKNVDETNAYTSPTYLTSNPYFHFGQFSYLAGAVGAEAAVTGVQKVSLVIDRPMYDKGFYADGTGLKAEPTLNGYTKITGSIETDFIDKTKFADLFVSGAAVPSIIFRWQGPIIASTFHNQLDIQLTDMFFDTDTPQVGGPDVVKPKINFTALYDDSNQPLTISYTSTDTTL